MSAKAKNKEYEYKYYEKAKKALEDHLINKGFHTDFEITGHPKGKAIPEKFLFKNTGLLNGGKLPTPDIMGLIWTSQENKRKLVVAEFKINPVFADIFQTKGYDELFDSDCTYLLSKCSISESSRNTMNFIRNNIQLLKTKMGKSEIFIMVLNAFPKGSPPTLGRLGTETNYLPDDYERLSTLLCDC